MWLFIIPIVISFLPWIIGNEINKGIKICISILCIIIAGVVFFIIQSKTGGDIDYEDDVTASNEVTENDEGDDKIPDVIPAGISIRVTGVSITKGKTIAIGDTSHFKLSIAPSNASNQKVAWNSSNTSVATVNEFGHVTGVSKGVAVIKVKTDDGGYTASCTVIVVAYPIPAEGVSITKGKTISIGNVADLEVSVKPSNASNQKVTWSSSDTSVATVNEFGHVTGVSKGVAIITVKTDDGGYTASCTVIVVL